MEHSSQPEDQSGLIAYLIAENKTLKRDLDQLQAGMGMNQADVSSSTTQKRIRQIRKSFPDQAEALFQKNAHAAQTLSNNKTGMEFHDQNEPELFPLLGNPNPNPDDVHRKLQRLVKDLPSNNRPELPNLNSDMESTEFKNIWKESNIVQFESMIRESLAKLYGPQTLDKTFQTLVRDMEENSGTTILDTCFSDDCNQIESPDNQTIVAMAEGLLQISLYLLCTSYFPLIWQLYHDNPIVLPQKISECYTRMALRTISIMSSAERHFETMILGTFPKRSRAMEEPKDDVTHDPIMIPAEQQAVKALLHEIKSKMQGSTDEDKLFTFCVLLARHPKILFQYGPEPLPYPFPAKIGFDAILSNERTETLSRIKTVIREFIKQRTGGSKKMREPSQILRGRERVRLMPQHGLLVYSVPGSGKTRLIESLLSKHWGFYFIAGNLEPHRSHRSVDENFENIYTARREGYSKDLHYLWKLIQFHHKTFPGQALWVGVLDYWLYLLFFSRFLVLDAFIEEIREYQKSFPLESKEIESVAPALWLRFQKEKDPFSTLFWLLVVQSPSFSEKDLWHTISAFTSNKSHAAPFLVCLDEAQIDLVDLEVRYYVNDQCSLSFLQFFVSTSARIFSYEPQITFIVSGTSLRLNEIRAELKRGPWSGSIDTQLYTDFPLLITDNDFEQLLLEKDFPLEDINDLEIKSVVLEHSRPFRGRYLWSVLYVDSLKRHIKDWQSKEISDADNLFQVIKEVAKTVMGRAKKDLKDHLMKIQNQELVQHLCWIVICCEILDRKKVIAKDRDNRLIDEGFATVSKESEDGRPKGSLVENIAMEAALEWFRDENAELVQRTMEKLLTYYAVDDSIFGKASEWFLAWELWSMLRQDDANQIIGSTKLQRREDILAILDGAVSVDELSQLAGKPKPKGISSLRSGGYFLVKGKRIGSSHDGGSCGADENATDVLRDKYDMWQYLRDIRTQCADDPPRSSVYFPENAAGPDLIFALEPAETKKRLNKRILCVIQLKTGTDYDIHDAIRTTDICTSYLGETAPKTREEEDDHLKKQALYEKRQNLIHELKHWHREGLRVIRILIATGKTYIQEPTEIQIAKSKKDFAAKHPDLTLNDYFILVSRKEADKFFGSTFWPMLTELKAKEGIRAIRTRAKLAPSPASSKDKDYEDSDVEMPDAS